MEFLKINWYLKVIVIFSVVALLAGGCTTDSNPVTTEDKNKVAGTWLWAFNDDDDEVLIYEAFSGVERASYSASSHMHMHALAAGPSDAPTVWMASGTTAYAFTAGSADKIPKPYATLEVGENPVHIGHTPDGMFVAFANDISQTISVIDVDQKEVIQTVTHASGHSSALLTGEYVITTAATGSGDTWAKIVKVENDSLVDSLTIGNGAHGDAYYAAIGRGFVACAGAIYAIDVAKREVVDSMPYTEEGRTSFMYYGHSSSVAVGLHNFEDSDKLMLIDMANNGLEYLTLQGSVLPRNITAGQFALTGDGHRAVIADLAQPRIFVVSTETGSVITLDAPAEGAAVAVNADASTVWAKSGKTISVIDVASNSVTHTFDIDEGTDWIYITSVN